jgi:hypothetical protein
MVTELEYFEIGELRADGPDGGEMIFFQIDVADVLFLLGLLVEDKLARLICELLFLKEHALTFLLEDLIPVFDQEIFMVGLHLVNLDPFPSYFGGQTKYQVVVHKLDILFGVVDLGDLVDLVLLQTEQVSLVLQGNQVEQLDLRDL